MGYLLTVTDEKFGFFAQRAYVFAKNKNHLEDIPRA